MSLIIDGGYSRPVEPQTEKPVIEPKPQTVQPAYTSKTGENNFTSDLLKLKLAGTFAAKTNVLNFTEIPGGSVSSIFADGYDGIGPVEANYVSPYSEDARPEEAASFLKYDSVLSGLGSKGQAFAEALELHKDDPEWTKNFLRELGKDTVAQYISDSFNGEFLTSKQMSKNSASIRTALETMVKNGDLTQDGMNALVKQLKDANPAAYTEIFAKSNDPQFKQMFIKATISSGDSHLQAAGAYVLQTFSSADQGKFLSGLTDNELNSFIEGAMAGQFQIQDPVYQVEHPGAPGREVPLITIGGVSSIVSYASQETGYNGSTLQYAPFSKQLQQRIFVAVGKGLQNPDAFNNFRDNKSFKDNLSQIFINHGAEILKAQAPDGGFQDAGFVSGMTKIFELTLFTKNPGGLRDTLMQSVIKTMSDVGDASIAPPMDPATYEKNHNGWSQQDHVEVMGGLQAMILRAAANQKDFIKNEILNDQAKRQELVGFITGMAFSFLPGAGEIFGKIAGEGASFFKQIPDKIISYTFDAGKSQISDAAQKSLANLLGSMNSGDGDALKDIDKFISGFKQTIVATSSTLPNGEKGENGAPDELDLRTAFQSAFAFYGDLLTF